MYGLHAVSFHLMIIAMLYVAKTNILVVGQRWKHVKALVYAAALYNVFGHGHFLKSV